jgi:predicted nucleic acid-binding Zn ribbon protein
MNRFPNRLGRAERVVEVRESVEQIARFLGAPPLDLLNFVFSGWAEIVGVAASKHCQPERIEGDSLLVKVDSPAWASYLRTHASEVVSRLSEAPGGDVLTHLVIRVGRVQKQPSDQGF